MPTRERDKQQYEAKLAALRAAIDEGDASGIATGNAFERIRENLHYTPEEIDHMISEGLDDIDRGDMIDGEEALRQLRALSAERRHQGK